MECHTQIAVDAWNVAHCIGQGSMVHCKALPGWRSLWAMQVHLVRRCSMLAQPPLALLVTHSGQHPKQRAASNYMPADFRCCCCCCCCCFIMHTGWRRNHTSFCSPPTQPGQSELLQEVDDALRSEYKVRRRMLIERIKVRQPHPMVSQTLTWALSPPHCSSPLTYHPCTPPPHPLSTKCGDAKSSN